MLSLATLRNFLTPHSLLLFYRPRNHHAATTYRRCYHNLSSLILAEEHAAISSLASKHVGASTPALEHTVTIIFHKASMCRSWSLSHYRHRPRPRLPQSAPSPPSSSSPRHVSHLLLSSLLRFTHV
jgi:hypothetical protein